MIESELMIFGYEKQSIKLKQLTTDPDNLLHERMEERELLVQFEAVVHRVLLPHQLVTDVPVALVEDDQLDMVFLDHLADGIRRQSYVRECKPDLSWFLKSKPSFLGNPPNGMLLTLDLSDLPIP